VPSPLPALPSIDDRLAAYLAPRFELAGLPPVVALPLDDEAFVATWRGYAARVAEARDLRVLADALPQLAFPIAAGISETDAYRAATRRGKPPDAAIPLPLRDATAVTLSVEPSLAGAVPVFAVTDRDDFEALVRAFTARNEPVPVPASQGACVVAGYVNWDRVRRARAAWLAAHPEDGLLTWSAEFARLKADPARWQDRFVILYDGPYSAVAARDLGLDDPAWRRLSLITRREHEAAHYLTKRLVGVMENRVHDELLADFAGMTAATGRYDARAARWFLGLEAYPAFRAGGRLANYRGTPPLDDDAFATLQQVVVRAIAAIAAAAREAGDLRPAATRAPWLLALMDTPVTTLAGDDGAAHVAAAVARWRDRVRVRE
jgi:hypothetical protein